MRDGAASQELLRRLGADIVETICGEFDLIVDGVGGATFGLAIEHVAARGVVVNIATQGDAETVTFHAARFDRARGATIYTLNLPFELASHASGASDLARLCALMVGGRLDGQIELEASHGATLAERLALCCSAASAARPCCTSTDRATPGSRYLNVRHGALSESPGVSTVRTIVPAFEGLGSINELIAQRRQPT